MGFTLAQGSWYIIGEEKISVKDSHLFKIQSGRVCFQADRKRSCQQNSPSQCQPPTPRAQSCGALMSAD